MAKLVLHIGAHKTGTSYLQSLFHHNRDLLARDGIHYPFIGPNMAHHALGAVWLDMPDIPARFFGPDGPEALWQRLLADYADKPGTLFLSAENFSRAYPQAVDMADLARRLAGFDAVRIVYTMRAQSEMIASLWVQVARERRPPNLRRYVERALKDSLGGGIPLDHCQVYKQLLKGFRPEQITLLDYGSFRTSPGGMAQVFLTLLGSTLPAAALAPPPPDEANVSPDPLATYVASQIYPSGTPPKDLIARAAQVLNPGAKQPTTLLTRREYTKVKRLFARRNQLLASWVQPVQPGFTFTPPPIPKGLIYRDDIAAQDLRHLAASLRHPLRHSALVQMAGRLWTRIRNKSPF